MKLISNIVRKVQHRIFKAVTSSNLVYNTCWEDPIIDRQLLGLDNTSRVLMLTSAGCNALDYLLDDVQRIHSVDINPAQNALLNIKKGFFLNGDYSLLWNFFGTGAVDKAPKKYLQHIRPYLSNTDQTYWDQNIHKFIRSRENTFYFTGTSGSVARLIQWRIKQKGLLQEVKKLVNATSLEEQAYYYDEIEPRLWNPFAKWLVRRHISMTLLGVPSNQRKIIEQRYQRGMVEFIQQSLRRVFTRLPIENNYFWRVYLTGSYSKECCPNYLKESKFETIKNRISRIKTHTTSLLNFLKNSDQKFSHFILLDHQDWMAYAQPDKLAREWRQILRHAKPGARILFRSADKGHNFLPDFAADKVNFCPEITKKMHQHDRVGTYESTHLAIVQ